MIDLHTYNLVYYRNDGVKYHVRRVASSTYKVINSETLEKGEFTHYKLRKEFVSDKKAAQEAIRKTYLFRKNWE